MVSFDQSTDWRVTDGWTDPASAVVHLVGDLALARRSGIARADIAQASGPWLAGDPETPIASLIDHEFAHVAWAEFCTADQSDCESVVRQMCRAVTGRTDRLAVYLRTTLTAAWDRHAGQLESPFE